VRLFGWTIAREKTEQKALQPVDHRGGWFSLIREPWTGAWQRNIEIRTDSVLTYSAVFRCISLISSDIAKMRIRLVAKDSNGIWIETENASHSPVLRNPNRFQTRIQFFANWVESKLVHGNAYILKERDARNVVTRLYVLDPNLVAVLVAPDGSVYYQLKRDDLAGIPERAVTVPASEIIQDQ
jgi:HK97 family phage portal protein